MSSRTLAKTKNQNSTTFSPVFGKKLSSRSLIPQPPDEVHDVSNPESGHNFGDIQVEGPSFKQSCPFSLSGPSHCPFGGACHTWPPRVQAIQAIGIQCKAISNDKLSKIPPIVYEVLRSSGQPLDPASRAFFEPRFGHDFSQVRVHTGEGAHQAAQALDSLAFTHSNQIFFESGAFSPNTSAGQHLLAHELSHVVQQSRQKNTLQSNHSSLDAEADNAAASFLNSQGAIRIGLSSSPGIARQKKPRSIYELESAATSEFSGTPMPQPLKLDQLEHIMPELKNAPDPQRYLDLTNQTFKLFNIDTVESRAFFLAQAKIETKSFQFLVEGDIDPNRRFVERDEDIYENKPELETHFYTPGQLKEFKKRYLGKRNIDVPAGRLPAGWLGPRQPNFAYVGRSPLQVTNKQNYKNAINALRRMGEQRLKLERAGKAPPVAEDIALQGIPPEKSLGEKIIIAAERLSQDPALAADPDYGFLLSGAFLKMGRSTKHGVTSMAMSASVWLQKGFGRKTFLGVGGPMFGRTLAQIQKFSESERELTLKNLAEKMEAYKEIRDYLMKSVSSPNTKNNP